MRCGRRAVAVLAEVVLWAADGRKVVIFTREVAGLMEI